MEAQAKGKVDALFRSRRFWVAVGAGIVAFTKQFGIDLDPDTVNNVITIAAAWILGDTFRRTE